jgi:capsular polysaccharide transport system permease protein
MKPVEPAAQRLSFGQFLAAFKVQQRVISALMIRELIVRYGRQNIGFLWVIIEPMILTIGVMFIWSLIKSPHEHGIQLVALVLTGYMPLTLWRHLGAVGVFFFRFRIGLLYHQHITLIDTIIARMMLEFIATTVAFAVVYIALVAADIIKPIVSLGPVIMGWTLLGLMSMGVAVLTAVLTEAYEIFEHFYQPFQYFMLPISGAFFMVEWLPTYAQELVWYNPTVHCYEMVRQGFFGNYVEAHYSVWYVAIWALVLLTVGFISIERIRDRLHL